MDAKLVRVFGGTAFGLLALTALCGSSAFAAEEVPPMERMANSNGLLKEYGEKVTVTASSYWPGWEPTKAFDGNSETSWFTSSGDSAAKGATPWIQVELPRGETVRRVTLLGNREPSWPTGFTIRKGKLELLDADGKVLFEETQTGEGDACDFDFRPKGGIEGVRRIRFTSLEDDGGKTAFEDIALGEFQVE